MYFNTETGCIYRRIVLKPNYSIADKGKKVKSFFRKWLKFYIIRIEFSIEKNKCSKNAGLPK